MELISFEGFSFRSKKASELGLVGKTFEQCSLIWADAVVVGVVDTRPEYFLDPKVAVKDHGIVCEPTRLITEHDRVIFIAKNAFPKKAGKILEKPELEEIPTRARAPFDILICGWREEWSDGERIRARIASLARGLGEGSRLEFLNLVEGDAFSATMAERQLLHQPK